MKNVVVWKELLRMELKVVKDLLYMQIFWELFGQQCWNIFIWLNFGDEGVFLIYCGWMKVMRFRIY